LVTVCELFVTPVIPPEDESPKLELNPELNPDDPKRDTSTPKLVPKPEKKGSLKCPMPPPPKPPLLPKTLPNRDPKKLSSSGLSKPKSPKKCLKMSSALAKENP
jgi:hypothetical protein